MLGIYLLRLLIIIRGECKKWEKRLGSAMLWVLWWPSISCVLDLRRGSKAQFCDDPPPPPPPKKKKYPQNLHAPKIFIFLKTLKNIEIQNFEPPKNYPSLRMYENIRVPPTPRSLGAMSCPVIFYSTADQKVAAYIVRQNDHESPELVIFLAVLCVPRDDQFIRRSSTINTR